MPEPVANNFERIWDANEAFQSIEVARKSGTEPRADQVETFLSNVEYFSELQSLIAERLRPELGESEVTDAELLGATYDALAESERGEDEETICLRALYKLSDREQPKSAEPTDLNPKTSEPETNSAHVTDMIDQSAIDQFALYRSGDSDAAIWLVNQYGAFVRSLARRLSFKLPRSASAIDYDDLVQEGMIAMLYAAESYRNDMGANFMTYSRTSILRKMDRHIKDMRSTVRVPASTRDKATKIEAINQLRRGERRPPLTPQEIAELVDVDPDDRYVARNYKDKTTVASLKHVQLITDNMGSLDRGFSPHNDLSPGNDYILDERNGMESITSSPDPDVEDEATNRLFRVEASKFLIDGIDSLSDREATILALRFGLDGTGIMKSLDEVAQQFDLSKERVRIIESHALSKLRWFKRNTYHSLFAS